MLSAMPSEHFPVDFFDRGDPAPDPAF